MSLPGPFFEPIKEHRGDYFVEYRPPHVGAFATLVLVFIAPMPPEAIAAAVERELQAWISRYPVPLMIYSTDETDTLISLEAVRPGNYLAGWLSANGVQQSWKFGDLDTFLGTAPPLDLKAIYHDVPYKTAVQVKAAANADLHARGRQVRALKGLLVFWLVVVPIGVATVEYFAPDWLAALIYAFALWQAVQKLRQLQGWKKRSKAELDAAEKKQKMEHYFYHCELNPVAFARLRGENLDREQRARTRAEAAQLQPNNASNNTS